MVKHFKNKAVSNKPNDMQPYIRLIEAIIESGKKTNDTAFLESNWYKYLYDNYIDLWKDCSRKAKGNVLQLPK